jgi:hypothetical protein
MSAGQNDWRARIEALNLIEEVQAAFAKQEKIGDDEIKIQLVEPLNGLLFGARNNDVISIFLQNHGEGHERVFLIID